MTGSPSIDDASPPGTGAEPLHAQGQRRWPRVAWVLASYTKHLAWVRGQEAHAPRFADDHWLGSAAGYWADGAWDAIEAEVRPDCFRGIGHRPTELAGFNDRDELWQETLTDKYLAHASAVAPRLPDEREPNKLAEYLGQRSLAVWFNTALDRKIKDAARRREPRQRREDRYDDYFRAHVKATGVDQNAADRPLTDQERRDAAQRDLAQARAEFKAGFDRAFDRFSDRQKFIYRLVFVENVERKDVAAMLGVHPGTVTRAILGNKTGNRNTPGIEDILREELGDARDLFLDLDRIDGDPDDPPDPDDSGDHDASG